MQGMSPTPLPEDIQDEAGLDEIITTPSEAVVEYMSSIEGDLVILGIGGKIGSHVGIMARKALDLAGKQQQRVFGVSRFSDPDKRQELEAAGVDTIACDLLDVKEVEKLPAARNVVFMAGRKFGTHDRSDLTWAVNTIAPALAAEHYTGSKMVAFSTGCVYDLVPVPQMGATEDHATAPLGEYSNSAVGREQVFNYYSRKNNSPTCLFRLNYAVDLRYGVLRDIGDKVRAGEEIDLGMGHVNVIWQGDTVQRALLCLDVCDVPAVPINITGPETAAVEYIARRFAELLETEARFTGTPAQTALLSNAARSFELFGYPQVTLETMIRWTAKWISHGGRSLNKPTHFETRDGTY